MCEAIIIENLSKYYNDFLALDNLSLCADEREKVALLGPNGAGKTTALKILCGLLRPSSGKVYIDGINVLKEREKALSKLGAILEVPEFYPFLTLEENLSYLGRLRGMQESEVKSRIKEVTKIVRLERWNKVKIEKFSRGMKQRLAIAQALLHDPPILVLDEPAVGLDPRGIAETRDILNEVGKEKTILYASHLLEEVVQICEKVALIDHAQLRVCDSIVHLKEKYGSLEKAYLELTEERVI